MKKTFTKLIAALALLVFMMPSLAGWGQTADYTIGFQAHSSSEQSTSLTDSNAKDKLSEGASYVTSITNVSKVYQAAPGNGWKLGTGSAVGTFLINLSSDGQVNATKITIKTKKYSSDTGKVKVTLNADNSLTHEITPGTTMADDEWTLSTTTAITSIKIETTSKRAYVHSVKVTYQTNTPTTDPNITFNNGSVNVGKTLDLNTLFESNSTGTVTYSITAGGSCATLSGSTLTGVAVGSVTVEASQAAAGSYNAGSATATITVNAAPTLSSIVITTPPTKTTYTEGETFDATGMVVTATYSDATTDDVTALCTFSPSGALTTSDTEITVSYTESSITKTAIQAITVNAYVQPTNFDINLNNSLFGTSYNGSASGITDEQPVSGTSNGVIVTYAGSGNHYINNSQIRFYPNNKLTFEAPSGYVIKSIVFTADGQWNATISANVGSYTDNDKTWTGSESSVQFIGSGSSVHCRMSKATITLDVPAPEYSITYAAVTSGEFDSSNPNSASAGNTVTVTTTPDAGYHLATLTYNDGTTTENATLSGNSAFFTMPEHNVTVSATFAENVATFTDGVYSEPITTQASFDNMTVIDNGGDQTWQFDSQYKYAKISGYDGNTNNANEDWLITPKMAVTNGKLDIAFETYHNSYGAGLLSVKWATTLNGTWNDAGFSEGDAGSFVASNLTIVTNDTDIYVAFVYTSTSSAAGTWEVKNFTAKQYYTITNGNPSNGSIEIEPNDKQVVGGTVLVEATPNANYHFVSWNITPAVTVESDAFTMPAANVTVSAVFEQDITYTITYNENGVTNTDDVLSGPIGSNLLDSPVSADPVNLEFVGWSTSQISKYATAQPELVDATYNVTGNVTFYAVYKYDYSYNEGGGTPTWTKVTDASTLAAGDQLVIASDAHNVVATEAISTSSNANYMSETGEDDLFESGVMNSLPTGAAVLTLGGEENAWTLTNSSSQLLGATAAKKLAWGSGTTTWSISISSGDATIQNGTSSYGKFLHNVSSKRFTTYTSDPSSSMLLPQLYRLEGGSTTVSGTYYLTSVTEITTATTIAANSTTTLTNNVTINSTTGSYTVNGILDGAGYIIINEQTDRLVVNNGGQLICDNAVAATVQKEIAAWTVDENNPNDETVKTDNWYFIASPLASDYSLTGTNMVSGTYQDYDLYRLNNTTWENYNNSAHTDFTALNNGTGYLYANKSNITLHFSGAINTFTNTGGANEKSLSAGWNLVGNPYTRDIYINKAYYKMNAAGNDVEVGSTSVAIPACTGVVIKSNGNENVTFSTSAPETSSYNGSIQMALVKADMRGNAVQDKAVVSFDEGMQLGKFIFNEHNAKLFIPQNGEDYAIAFSDRQGDVPVCFKTKELGTYTINFSGEDVELDGMYLVDVLEGLTIDLSVNPSYTFIGSPSDRQERFRIKFGENANAVSDMFAYQNGSDIVVNGEGELQVFDVTGRMVMSATVNGVETINGLESGVYVFRMVGNDVKTQKIVIR